MRDARTLLLQMCGVDLTRIDVTTAFKVLAEVGADLSRFKNAKHFASWLGLCPGTKISGGKVLSARTSRNANRAARAYKLARLIYAMVIKGEAPVDQGQAQYEEKYRENG